MSTHPLLKQQLTDLVLITSSAPTPEEWKNFLTVISATYEKLDLLDRNSVLNALNNLNTSVELISESIERTRLKKLIIAMTMIQQHAASLAGYLTEDPKGKILPSYIIKLIEVISQELQIMKKEIHLVQDHLERFKHLIILSQEKRP